MLSRILVRLTHFRRSALLPCAAVLLATTLLAWPVEAQVPTTPAQSPVPPAPATQTPPEAESEEPEVPQSPARAPEPLVLYTTLEPAVVNPLLTMFTSRSEIPVRVVFESELPGAAAGALANRLKAERVAGKATADAWWGLDLLEVQSLSAAGVLAPYESDAAARHAGAGATSWPAELRATDGSWYGLARRVRVLIYNTDHVSARDLPTDLGKLTDARWKGRTAIANPARGTDALTHLAAIRASQGETAFTDWVRSIAANGPIVGKNEKEVVAAVASGQAHLGLTSSDAAIRAAKAGQPIRMRLVSDWQVIPKGDLVESLVRFSPGLAQLPSGVAVVRGGANAEAAEFLIDFLISNEVAQVLERGPLSTIGLGETSHDGLKRWCDGATGPGRQQRMVLDVSGFSAGKLGENVQPAFETWTNALPSGGR